MTIKEISELTGKSARTVLRWAAGHGKSAEDKMSAVEDKMSSAGHGKSADFSLVETLWILKGNMSESFISLLKENAAKNNNIVVNNNGRIDRLESLVEKLILSIPTIVKETVNAVSSQKQLEYIQDYYSVIGYANKNRIAVAFSDALKYGKEEKRLSVEKNIEVRKIADERWGEVNSYHVDILKEVFAL